MEKQIREKYVSLNYLALKAREERGKMVGITYYKYNKHEVTLLERTEYGYKLIVFRANGKDETRDLFLHEGVAMLEKGKWTLKVLD